MCGDHYSNGEKKIKKAPKPQISVMSVLLGELPDRSPVFTNSGKNLVSDRSVARINDYLRVIKKMTHEHYNDSYKPRELQQQVHKNLKRFNVLVCHRRFGKTVLTVNELIKRCLQCDLLRPRYYYIAPTCSMAKRIAWDYLKYYTSVLFNMDYHETELRAELPNGGRIQLLGCERPQTLKGLYIDGVVLDEVADATKNVD